MKVCEANQLRGGGGVKQKRDLIGVNEYIGIRFIMKVYTPYYPDKLIYLEKGIRFW